VTIALQLKPDFESMIPRMEAFWRGELLDRCCIGVEAPKAGVKRREVKPPPTLREKWLNMDYVLDAAEARMEATYYAGEAFPFLRPNLGPDLFAALLGGRIEYREDTTWVAPYLDWERPPSFDIDKSSAEWRWHGEIYRRAAPRARGRYLVGAPDCHAGGDALLAMRGGTNLCMDLYDVPEKILAAMRKLERAVVEFYAAWWPLIEASGQTGHTCSWLGTWSPGRSGAMQIDLLALISPAMFEEFFYNELLVQCGILENKIFHLDGPDAVRHLPKLCELPGVAAIQWVHGAGKGPMTKWIPLLKEMQSRGQGLHLSCEPQEVRTLLKELSSRGVIIRTWADTAREADELVKLAAKLTRE
jgi:hypothetical protein